MSEPSKSEEALEQIEERLVEAEVRMEKSVEALLKELTSIRTGRANPSLVERLQVDLYGIEQPMQSIANISAPEARLIVIKPYDKTAISPIEKAIQRADLGLNPSNDGQIIRIAIPPLTEDRRKDFVKVVHSKAEEGRIAVRNIRRDEVEHVRKVEKDGHVSRDELERSLSEIQKITDQFIGRVDDIAKKKEAEILEV